MAKSRRPKIKEIVAELERFFGQRVMKMAAPGGKARDSYRVHFDDRSIIVTYRESSGRTRLEARVLQALSPICPEVPQFLGCENNFLYQGDVGDIRLSQQVHNMDPSARPQLAAKAVTAIFRIQNAARHAPELNDLPHLGAEPEWVASLVDSIDKLAVFLRQGAPEFDRVSVCERLSQPSAQFVKWDCRAGNAAVDPAGKVSWFDFEYCGRRHGAEDLAWLIGDEIWPVEPQVMFDIVNDAFDPATGHARDAYLDYLGLYTTFHAIQRVLLVIREVKRRGWSTQDRALRYDKVGTHPLLGAGIADTAAFCADRNPLTRPLRPLLEEVSRTFSQAMPDNRRKMAS